MKFHLLLASTLLLAVQANEAFGQTRHASTAQHEAGHAHFCDVQNSKPKPILSVADFDGDGTVSRNDISLVEQQAAMDKYIAYYDRDADGEVSISDVELTVRDLGKKSNPTDMQLAMAFLRTEHYRDQREAIADGYIPYTGAAHGHGVHWGQHPESGATGDSFTPGNPFGLNYDRNGHLWGVFYFIGASEIRSDGTLYPPGDEFNPLAEAPDGFFGDEDIWHYHAGVCIKGLDYDDPSLNPADVTFTERVSPRECLPEIKNPGMRSAQSVKWVPKIYMIHAWLYELNPCGTFAGAHPLLAVDAVNPADAVIHPERTPSAPHENYDFEGGTMCHWLSEIEVTPEYCRRGPAQ